MSTPPFSTAMPCLMRTSRTRPARGALISFSIFIASRDSKGCPSVTASPSATRMRTTSAGMGATISFLCVPDAGTGMTRRTGSTYLFVHEGREVPVIVESDHEREMRRVMPVQATGPQKNEIVAPMPALVVRIHVAEGDEVAEGQPLLALEAMKMENVISAPRA